VDNFRIGLRCTDQLIWDRLRNKRNYCI